VAPWNSSLRLRSNRTIRDHSALRLCAKWPRGEGWSVGRRPGRPSPCGASGTPAVASNLEPVGTLRAVRPVAV